MSGALPSGRPWSQFHYGSITTKNSEIRSELYNLSQFHYGSITTPYNLDGSISPTLGLNSTMVRLQPGRITCSNPNLQVSIPLWFDYNLLWILIPLIFCEVSIPLWFDYNLSAVPFDGDGR